MKPADIKKGARVTVGWFHRGYMMTRHDYLATGTVEKRRAGEIKFRWESGDDMNADFPGWPQDSMEFFRVHVRDIKSINGMTLAEFAAATPAKFSARATLTPNQSTTEQT